MRKLKSIFRYCAYLIVFFVFLSITAILANKFFHNSLWGKLDQPYIQIFDIRVTITYFIHVLLGLPLYIYGLYLVRKTTIQNHMVQDRKNRKPTKLLTEGVYAIQRHPMYAGFICVQVGLWFSVYSPIGYVIGGLVTLLVSLNSIYEEKNELEILFPIEYAKYKIDVPKRVFTKYLICYFAVLIIVAIISLVTIG